MTVIDGAGQTNGLTGCLDAFISYSRQDAEDVNFVVERLNERGLRCFIDLNMDPGSNWMNEISEKIHQSETFLFFIRKKPVSVHFGEFQIAMARSMNSEALGKPYIIPILLPGAEPDAFFRARIKD